MEIRVEKLLGTKYSGPGPEGKELNAKQRLAVEEVKYRMVQLLLTESEVFYRLHPELHLSWTFECSATEREAGEANGER